MKTAFLQLSILLFTTTTWAAPSQWNLKVTAGFYSSAEIEIIKVEATRSSQPQWLTEGQYFWRSNPDHNWTQLQTVWNKNGVAFAAPDGEFASLIILLKVDGQKVRLSAGEHQFENFYEHSKDQLAKYATQLHIERRKLVLLPKMRKVIRSFVSTTNSNERFYLTQDRYKKKPRFELIRVGQNSEGEPSILGRDVFSAGEADRLVFKAKKGVSLALETAPGKATYYNSQGNLEGLGEIGFSPQHIAKLAEIEPSLKVPELSVPKLDSTCEDVLLLPHPDSLFNTKRRLPIPEPLPKIKGFPISAE
jgi:hypothetical protein